MRQAGKSAASTGPPLPLDSALEESIRQLDQQDAHELAMATAALTMLIQRMPDNAQPLGDVVPKLIQLLSFQDNLVQVICFSSSGSIRLHGLGLLEPSCMHSGLRLQSTCESQATSTHTMPKALHNSVY